MIKRENGRSILPSPVRRVIDEDVADQLTTMLVSVVGKGRNCTISNGTWVPCSG